MIKRLFTGAATLVIASLSVAILACPSVVMAQDRTLTASNLSTAAATTSADSKSESTSLPIEPPCETDCITRSEAYSWLRTYDSRQDENNTYQGEFMAPLRSKSDYSHVVPTRGDTPAHQHFRWVYRRFDVKTGNYMGPVDPDGSTAKSIDAIKDACVTGKIAVFDKEDGASEMIPLAKLKEWGFMTASCVDQALSQEEEGDNVDVFLCMRDGDGDPRVANHCFGWAPEKVIHQAHSSPSAENDQSNR